MGNRVKGFRQIHQQGTHYIPFVNGSHPTIFGILRQPSVSTVGPPWLTSTITHTVPNINYSISEREGTLEGAVDFRVM